MEKKKIAIKQQLSCADAISYLEDLLISLKSGTVVLEKDGEYVQFSPAESLSVSVEAKVKKGKNKFGLELTWSTPPENEEKGITISDAIPAPVEQPLTVTSEELDIDVPDEAKVVHQDESTELSPAPAGESSTNETKGEKSAAPTQTEAQESKATGQDINTVPEKPESDAEIIESDTPAPPPPVEKDVAKATVKAAKKSTQAAQKNVAAAKKRNAPKK